MDIATPYSELYNRLQQLGWEITQAPSHKLVDGNIMYQVRAKSPTGETVERVAASSGGALASLLHYAQRFNHLRGAAVKNIPAEDPNRNYDPKPTLEAAGLQSPQQLTGPEDPNDYVDWQGHHDVMEKNAIPVAWGEPGKDQQKKREIIHNALFVAVTSPRKEFHWNAVHYQHAMDAGIGAQPEDYSIRLDKTRRHWNAVQGRPLFENRPYAEGMKRILKELLAAHPEVPHDARQVWGTPATQAAQQIIYKLIAQAQKTGQRDAYEKVRDGEIREEDVPRYIRREADILVKHLLMERYGLRFSFPHEPGEKQKVFDEHGLKSGGWWMNNGNDMISKAIQDFKYDPNVHKYAEEEEVDPRLHNLSPGLKTNDSGTAPRLFGPWMDTHFEAMPVVDSHLDQLVTAADEDFQRDKGAGWIFRNTLLKLNIPRINEKVASFAWLLATPQTSQLATLDTHMNRILRGSPETGSYMPGHTESDMAKPRNYYMLEREMAATRHAMGYDKMPLGAFQWLLWDISRYPHEEGEPQKRSDHSAHRPYEPNDYNNVVYHVAPQDQRTDPFWKDREHHPYIDETTPHRVAVAQDYHDRYGGYGQAVVPDATVPKPPKPDKRIDYSPLTHVPWNDLRQEERKALINQTPDFESMSPEEKEAALREYTERFISNPTMRTRTAAVEDDENYKTPEELDRWFDFGPAETDRDNEDYENNRRIYREDEPEPPYEGINDPRYYEDINKLKPSDGEGYGRHAFIKGASLDDIREHISEVLPVNDELAAKTFLKNAIKGYNNESERDRENKIAFGARTKPTIRWPESFALATIAQGLGTFTDLDSYDESLEEAIGSYHLGKTTNIFEEAARLIRSIQKVAGDSSTGMAAGLLLLESNGYPEAIETIDDERLASLILDLRTAEANESDVAEFLEDQLKPEEATDDEEPDYQFVYWQGMLNVRPYDHNNSYVQMLEEMLKSGNKQITDDNVQDNDIASGEITEKDGVTAINFKSFADTDIQNEAIEHIHSWLEKHGDSSS